MKTYRMNAVMAGALYITGTVAGVLSVVTVGGFPDETFLARAADDPSAVALGALLVLVMGLSLAAMTVFLYPLFRKDSEILAMGMVLFRGALEGTWYILTTLSWLLLGALGVAAVAAGADSAALQAGGDAVLQTSAKLGDVGTIAFLVGASCLYASFYRTRLIPRWLSGWGLIAVVPFMMNALLHYFDVDLGSGMGFLEAPLAAQEMVMALWLIIKGFDPEAVERLDQAS